MGVNGVSSGEKRILDKWIYFFALFLSLSLSLFLLMIYLMIRVSQWLQTAWYVSELVSGYSFTHFHHNWHYCHWHWLIKYFESVIAFITMIWLMAMCNCVCMYISVCVSEYVSLCHLSVNCIGKSEKMYSSTLTAKWWVYNGPFVHHAPPFCRCIYC